ncbi:MAG: ABC transporter ATP-binding protein [Phycisphaerales bacterium]|nr:ABC transporter ATP-binding protein [Phycisphaerales bacterium]
MIDVERVSKQFAGGGGSAGGVMAVRDVSLSITDGVVTGLLGPNGAGKTTLIRMITGFLTPSRGRVRVCGHDAIEESGPARRCIGFLPESAPLYPEMRVRQFLSFRASLFKIPRAERASAIDGSLRRCELLDMQDRRIGQLSKGYRQRVGLASAILHRPPVLILDEPSSGLDPAQIRSLRQTIRDLASEPLDEATAKRTGLSKRVVLLSSHSLPEVRATCDRIVIMARGQVRAAGAPDELLEPLRAAAPWRVEIGQADGSPPPLARVQELLAGVARRVLSCSPTPGNGVIARLEMATPSPSHPAAAAHPGESLFRAIAGAGLTIRSLGREEPTLEDVFLAAVEDRAESETSPTLASSAKEHA